MKNAFTLTGKATPDYLRVPHPGTTTNSRRTIMNAPTTDPKPAAVLPKLLICSDIARLIAKKRGHCNRVSVWRAIKRLKLRPIATTGKNLQLYSEEQAATIEANLRSANNGSGSK